MILDIDAGMTWRGPCASCYRVYTWYGPLKRGFEYICEPCAALRYEDMNEKTPTVVTDAKARKALPLFSGFVKYFPDAMVAVAELSRIGNDQHNPGQPLHWAKEKSTDEHDALMRHLLDAGTIDTDGVRHSTKVAWRAMAALQRELDAAKETK